MRAIYFVNSRAKSRIYGLQIYFITGSSASKNATINGSTVLYSASQCAQDYSRKRCSLSTSHDDDQDCNTITNANRKQSSTYRCVAKFVHQQKFNLQRKLQIYELKERIPNAFAEHSLPHFKMPCRETNAK